MISGPGVTNVLTPIAQARQDARPLLVLSASVSRDERGRGRGVIHDLPDQAALTRAVTRLTVSIDEPDELAPALDAAWAVLEGRQGPPGPVHLQVPVDVLRLAAGMPARVRCSRRPAPRSPPTDAHRARRRAARRRRRGPP